MKKLLVASTALVAFAAVSSAEAADPVKISVGGYMKQWVGYASNDETGSQDFANVLNQSDTELYFTGSTKLDNGLTVKVVIQEEQDRGSTGQDDVFMSIKGDNLGEFRLGATKGASYTLSHTAPNAGAGVNDGDVGNWFNDAGGMNDILGHVNTQFAAGDHDNHNDGQKVVYYTPNFAGFQAGVSYGLAAAGNGTAKGGVNLNADGNDYVVDAGIGYNGEVSGVSVGADVSYVNIQRGGTDGPTTGYDTSTVRGGLVLGMAGFKFGGSYAAEDNVDGTKDKDSSAWDLGVSYATGPYAVSLTYINYTEEESGAVNAKEDTVDVYELGGTYDLGAGVSLIGSVMIADIDDGSNNTANENSAWGVLGGVKVSF